MKHPKKGFKTLNEITNTPKSGKIAASEPERCTIVTDEEIMDLNLVASDDELFEDVFLDVRDLVFDKHSSKI